MKKTECTVILVLLFTALFANSEVDSLISKLSIYEDSAQTELDSVLVTVYPSFIAEPLVKRLNDDDWTKRQTALRVLAKLKERRELLNIMKRAGVRESYILAAMSGDTQVHDSLALYSISKKADVRLAYYRYLSSLPGGFPDYELIGAFEKENDIFMRAALLNALSIHSESFTADEKGILKGIFEKYYSSSQPRLSYAMNRILSKTEIELNENSDCFKADELRIMKHDAESFNELAASECTSGMMYLYGLAFIKDPDLMVWIAGGDDSLSAGKKKELLKYTTE